MTLTPSLVGRVFGESHSQSAWPLKVRPCSVFCLERDGVTDCKRSAKPTARAMVDCIYIDPAYDGRVLNVGLADMPERKSDLVNGKYELPALADETTVAVKVVDMLGEEVVVTATV